MAAEVRVVLLRASAFGATGIRHSTCVEARADPFPTVLSRARPGPPRYLSYPMYFIIVSLRFYWPDRKGQFDCLSFARVGARARSLLVAVIT